jgi:transposase
MTHLSLEAKEAIILKAINRSRTTTLKQLARDNNVGISSLQRWIYKYQSGQPLSVEHKNNLRKAGLSNSEKFKHIVATTNLDDVSLGKYCRENGLYSHQIDKWRKDFMKPKQELKSTKEKLELAKLKKEIDSLKRDLRRKDKALAEASALLIMKKKADLIWGEDEED